MDSYNIRWKKSAVKELKKINKNYILKILKAVENLSSEPYPRGVKKLIGSEITYRIRIGDYRVIYDVYKSELIVEIIRVRHRKNVYD